MIPRAVVPSVSPCDRSPARVARDFRRLLDEGAELLPGGSTRRRPRRLLSLGYTPKAEFHLFDAHFWLSTPRQNEDIRFFVAYVSLDGGRKIHPRIFYKDVSLTWRSASHFVRSNDENWIGKGDLTYAMMDGERTLVSDEATTDLPLEMQTALEELCRRATRFPHDDEAVGRVLRRGPDDRLAPYRDFTGPRRKAEADPRNLPHRGRRVARFRRSTDPGSLTFVPGFEPDFRDGIVEVAHGTSRLYEGKLRRYRIVSKNREAQYLFFAAPRLVWIGSCQATTTELSTFGVRTVDLKVDDDLMLPGYEYHYVDDFVDPPELYSQIPKGFAGPVSPVDAYRADASAWIDRMPVIREFRRVVLGQGKRRR